MRITEIEQRYLLLKYEDGLSPVAIAERVGRSLSTVRYHLSMAEWKISPTRSEYDIRQFVREIKVGNGGFDDEICW